ncbi:ribonuclease J [Thermodesulfobacteriota bacterium]
MLKIIALGGLGEIGLNMMVFEYGESMIIIDAGLMFPEDYMLGVDYVIPDMEYLEQKQFKKIDAIILTHAHEDHIGALPYLLKKVAAPVFATPFTLGIVRHKLEDHGLSLATISLNEIFPRQRLHFSDISLEFIRVGHSVIDGVGLAIKTPTGLIVHTGDFKINHTSSDSMMTDVSRFARCGEEGVLALLSDSTNIEREGYTISDTEVGDTLARIAGRSKGRVIVALFASNIARIQQIVNIARDKGRKIVINGKSIEISVNIAKELGYLHIPEKMEIGVGEVNYLTDDQIVIATTGSQGEPMSALARMASGAHKQIKIKEGDTVILSSKFIPGNEKAITNIINELYRKGADVIYEKISAIHVSGHAFQEELKLMISLTKPEYFIPIHGEYRHMTLHARLAEQMGIPKEKILVAENGQIIQFDETGGKIVERVETGRILIDGKGVGDVGKSVLKERRTLSEDGLVAVTLAFDEETGYVVYGPELESRGFVFEMESGHLLEDAKCVILEIIEDIDMDVPGRIEKIRLKIRSALRKYFYFAIGRRPVVLPFILEI